MNKIEISDNLNKSILQAEAILALLQSEDSFAKVNQEMLGNALWLVDEKLEQIKTCVNKLQLT